MNICESARFYSAYNLTVHSELCLPELPAGGAAFDVSVRVGAIRCQVPVLDDSGRGFQVNGGEAYYFLKDVGAFAVASGEDILVEPWSDGESLRLSLLGPAIALLLQQRGTFVLHAGAVAMDGRAVAFLGGTGWGKSTLVAMLHARGHRFLCEDVAGLTSVAKDVHIIPSFPQFKLWPDAAERLGWSPAEFPQVHPACEKRLIRFSGRFSSLPVPLHRIYVLGVGPNVSIEPLQPVEQLEEILRHWYGARFGPDYLHFLDRRNLFLRAAEIVRAAPVRVLRRPASFHEDPALPEVIEREILRDLRIAPGRTKRGDEPTPIIPGKSTGR